MTCRFLPVYAGVGSANTQPANLLAEACGWIFLSLSLDSPALNYQSKRIPVLALTVWYGPQITHFPLQPEEWIHVTAAWICSKQTFVVFWQDLLDYHATTTLATQAFLTIRKTPKRRRHQGMSTLHKALCPAPSDRRSSRSSFPHPRWF